MINEFRGVVGSEKSSCPCSFRLFFLSGICYYCCYLFGIPVFAGYAYLQIPFFGSVAISLAERHVFMHHLA